MALTVGELVGYIRLDDEGWNNRLQAAEAGFAGLQNAVKTGAVALAGSFTAAVAATVGLGAAVFTTGANYNILQQSSRAALETLLGGAEAANVQMDKLDAFAKNSPFAKQVFITAQQQLIGFGVEAENVIPILDAVQNAVAAVGGNNEQVSQVTYALSQMQGQGKLTGETLNQLGQYGIDAAGILGEEFGKTGAEIRAMASEPGGIPVDQVWQPLIDGLMENFGGATDAIKEQWVGSVDRIKGAWRDIGSTLAAPFIDPAGGGMAVVWANQVADALRALEQKAKPLVDLLMLRFKPTLDAISPALERVKSGINAIDLRDLTTGLDNVTKYAPLVAGLTAVLIAMGGPALLGPLGLLVPKLNPVIAGLAALVAFTPGMEEVGETFVDSLAPMAPVAEEIGTALLDSLMGVLEAMVPALQAVAEAVGPLTMALADSLAPAVIAVVESLVPVAEAVAGLVEWFAQLPTPVLAAGTAFVFLSVGPVAALIASIRVGLVGAFTTFTTSMAASRAVAATMGTSLSTMGALAATARVGISGLGTSLLGAFGGPVGLLVLGVAAAFGVFINSQMKAKKYTDDLASSLDEVTGSVTANTRAIMASKLATENGFWNDRAGKSPLDDAKLMGVALDTMTDAAMGNTDAMEEVAAAKAAYWESFDGDLKKSDEAKAAWRNIDNAIKDNAGSLEEATAAEETKREAIGESTDAIEEATNAVDLATESTVVWTAALSENTTAALDNSGGVLSAKEAALRYQEAVATTSQKIAENNAIIAENTAALNSGTLSAEDAKIATDAIAKAQRDNEDSTLSLTRAGLAQIEANAKNNASGDDLRAQMATLRTEVVNSRIAMGESTEQANAYADSLGLIPDSVVTTIEATDLASGVLSNVVQKLVAFDGKVYTAIARVDSQGTVKEVSFPGSGLTMKEDGGIVTAYASGGIAGDGSAVDRVSQIAAGGRNILWAEPATGWEAYISGKPGARNRNLAILDETARRLGRITVPADSRQYASGNVSPASSAPAAGGSQMPDTIVLVDVDGTFLARMRVEAGRVMTGKTTPLSEGRPSW